ncbi:hypothetical protein [Rossellomorea marisflavi]|uniref:hypothetical protein n=1 Tax=Rossellomorea marisflavi TaxID=189381 RepID=UPI00345C892B
MNIISGDYVFSICEPEDFKKCNKLVHELRMKGFRKVNHEFSFQDQYEHYKKGKEFVIVTSLGL